MRRVLVLGIGTILAAAILAPNALASHRLVVDNDRADCPNADFTSIQAAVTAADPNTRILVCPGTYRERVIVATHAKDGIQLVSRGGPDDVILDGDFVPGFPTGHDGITLQDVSGVLVRGFTVTEFHENIRLLSGANGNTIRGNVAKGPSGHDGIRLDGAHNNVIRDNATIDNGTPVNGCGIDLLAGSSGNLVRGNFATLNDRAGIRLTGAGTGNVVRDNELRNNGRAGILNSATTGTLIVDNDARHSAGVGAELGHGIHVLNSGGLTVRNNTTDRNIGDGIFLENADTNSFRDNESEDNGRDGIRADSASAGNTIRGNELKDNVEHDCHDDSVGGGTAGTANFWIDNEGETENRPGLCRDDDEDDEDEDEDEDEEDDDDEDDDD
jgi:parallel beta-helix repeat protein